MIASLLSVLAEGLGLGLILPLLASYSSVVGIGFLSDIPFLGDLSSWLGNLTLIGRVPLAAVVLVVIIFMPFFFRHPACRRKPSAQGGTGFGAANLSATA